MLAWTLITKNTPKVNVRWSFLVRASADRPTAFRHQFETYQAAEGLAEMAEKNAHADDDGHIE
jgi:hypothetical protein